MMNLFLPKCLYLIALPIMLAVMICPLFLFVPNVSARAAGSGFIEDDAHVLDVNQVSEAAASFRYELDMYTTDSFDGDAGQLAHSARQHLTTSNSGEVVLMIDTRQHHLALVGNNDVSFTDQQYRTAVNAFARAYQQRQSYTDATLAVIHSLSGDAKNNMLLYVILFVVFLIVVCVGLRFGWFDGIILYVGSDNDDGNSGGGAIGTF